MTKRESGVRGCRVSIFPEKASAGGAIHLRLEEVGHNGHSRRLAITRRCRPCQGTLKSNVFASCYKYKQKQRFSRWNSCLAISVSCSQPPLPFGSFPLDLLLRASRSCEAWYPNSSWGPGKTKLLPDMVAMQEAHRLLHSHKEK